MFRVTALERTGAVIQLRTGMVQSRFQIDFLLILSSSMFIKGEQRQAIVV
jgi:hypothetical protein